MFSRFVAKAAEELFMTCQHNVKYCDFQEHHDVFVETNRFLIRLPKAILAYLNAWSDGLALVKKNPALLDEFVSNMVQRVATFRRLVQRIINE